MSWTILQPKMLYEKNPELKAMKTPHQAKRWWQEQRGGRSFLKSYFGAKLALKKKKRSCYEWLFCTCLESAGVINNSSFKWLPAPGDELSQASIGQVSATPQVQRAQRATASGQHTGYNIIVFDLQVRQEHLLSIQYAAFAAHKQVPRGTFGRFRPALMCKTTLVVCCSRFRCYDLYTSVWAMYRQRCCDLCSSTTLSQSQAFKNVPLW